MAPWPNIDLDFCTVDPIEGGFGTLFPNLHIGGSSQRTAVSTDAMVLNCGSAHTRANRKTTEEIAVEMQNKNNADTDSLHKVKYRSTREMEISRISKNTRNGN